MRGFVEGGVETKMEERKKPWENAQFGEQKPFLGSSFECGKADIRESI
jgi:hypothetical protein